MVVKLADNEAVRLIGSCSWLKPRLRLCPFRFTVAPFWPAVIPFR